MQMVYYGYSFSHTDVDHVRHILMPVNPVLAAFCKINNHTFRTSFTKGGDNLFLIPAAPRIYLFIITRNGEIIRKINSESYEVSEIHSLLEKGEHIGFASYVIVQDNHLGFVSTMLSPRVSVFSEFVNTIFLKNGIHDVKFSLHIFARKATKADIMSLHVAGRSMVKVNSSNPLFDQIREFFGGSASDFDDVGSFELVMIPKRRRNIIDAARRLASTIEDDGLERMMVKTKDEVAGAMIDLYVAGQGAIADQIGVNNDVDLYNIMAQKIAQNTALKKKVTEHEQHPEFEKDTIESVSNLSDPGRWILNVGTL